MMTDALINTALDYGALGLFAAFMVWQHLTMTKRQQQDQVISSERSDATQTRFDERLTELSEKYETREDALRERYDKVLKEQQDKNDETKEVILEKLKDVHSMMESGLGEMRRHYEESRIKELARNQKSKS
tara:strand:+ start:669 stop:1061 length:393 start_codon:yes stop_codon:yes gene_type:complete